MWGDDWGLLLWGAPAVPTLGPAGLALLVTLLGGAGWAALRPKRAHAATTFLLLALGLAAPLAAFAAISVPYVFVNGTPADADEVNANFQTLIDRRVGTR